MAPVPILVRRGATHVEIDNCNILWTEGKEAFLTLLVRKGLQKEVIFKLALERLVRLD